MTSRNPEFEYAQALHNYLNAEGFLLRVTITGDSFVVHYQKAPNRVRAAVARFNAERDTPPRFPVKLKKAKW